MFKLSCLVGFCRLFVVSFGLLATYHIRMELRLFCDSYIIGEYIRLKSILASMPRYRLGMHKGLPTIRGYSGSGSALTKKETQIYSSKYAEEMKKLELFNSVSERERLFFEEFKRRHLIVPSDFRFKRDPSKLNVAYWNQEVPCSNKLECTAEYYDDYGFNVRSRGEMIVGNALKSLGLEAKYEPLVDLKGLKRKSPDYSFPVHIIDRCFFVEFMGMADDEEYIDDNAEKIRLYMRSGILPNRDLILISGTKNWIPTQESIARTIAAFINNAVLSAYNKQSF